MTIITPTVGRIVWYHPGQVKPAGFISDRAAPCAAIVTYVHHDRMINLVAFDQNGGMHPRNSVQMYQENDPTTDEPVEYAEWMPYQLGQAKKHEDPASEDKSAGD